MIDKPVRLVDVGAIIRRPRLRSVPYLPPRCIGVAVEVQRDLDIFGDVSEDGEFLREGGVGLGGIRDRKVVGLAVVSVRPNSEVREVRGTPDLLLRVGVI